MMRFVSSVRDTKRATKAEPNTLNLSIGTCVLSVEAVHNAPRYWIPLNSDPRVNEVFQGADGC